MAGMRIKPQRTQPLSRCSFHDQTMRFCRTDHEQLCAEHVSPRLLTNLAARRSGVLNSAQVRRGGGPLYLPVTGPEARVAKRSPKTATLSATAEAGYP
jgi:hypothetical protein